jgi:hypothetical protein
MSNSFKSLLASIVLVFACIIITGGCGLSVNNDAPIAFNYHYEGFGLFNVRSHDSPGIYTLEDNRLAHALDSFMKVLNGRNENLLNKVVTGKLDFLEFTILDPQDNFARAPGVLAADFSAFQDCQLVLYNIIPNAPLRELRPGDSVSIKFPNVVGNINRIVANPNDGTDKRYNLTGLLKESPNFSCLAYFRTTRPTPYTKIRMHYSFDISYSEEIRK